MTEHRTPDQPDRDALRALLGAYVLDALDDEERAAVDQFILDDQDARAELHSLQLGAAWLSRSAERPSKSVWNAIASEMAADLASSADDGTTNVAPLRPRATRLRTSSVGRALGIAAVLVTALVVAGGIRTALDPPTGVGDAALTSAFHEAQARPGARSVTLETKQGAVALEAVVLDDGTGIALPKTLSALDEQRTYQLWSITDRGAVSLGILGASPGAHTFHVAPGSSTLALTNEPRGGSTRPTGIPVASADLDAV